MTMITTSNGNEREWTISFPKFGNRKEIKKAKFWNEKGLKKAHFEYLGTGIGHYHSREWPGTGMGVERNF